MAINVLFWTNSANYPGVDGMLWLAYAKTLVLLQITLSSVQGHESNFWVGDDSRTSLWRNRLGAHQIKELWLTPYTSAGKKPAHAWPSFWSKTPGCFRCCGSGSRLKRS